MFRSVSKPILPERTKNKVNILGANWRQEILNIAVPEALPTFWNDDEVETVFLADVKHSVSVDPNNYYKDGPLANSTLLTIPAGKTGSIDMICRKDQMMTWIFEMDGHLSYGVYYSDDTKCTDISKMTVVYPRFNKVPGPTYVPIKDYVICHANGLYKIWFSNEHAWLHTLKIRHNVTVV